MQFLNVFIFCLIIFIMFVLSFFEGKLSQKGKKRIIFVFSLFIALVCGVRVIGLDLEPYRVIFDQSPIVSLNAGFIQTMFFNKLEPAFTILISVIKTVGLGFNSFLFVSAVLPMYLIYRVITKVEKDFPIITFLFFLLIMLFRGPIDTVRHFFAAAIYLSALYSLANNKKFKFYAKSIVSVLFHYSNVVIFFIRPFLNMKWKTGKYLTTLFVLGLLAFASKGVFIEYISGISFTNQIMWKFQYYLLYGSERYEYLNTFHKVLWYVMNFTPILFSVFVILWALKFRSIIEKDKFYHLLLNSQIIGSIMVLFFTAFDATTLGLRINFLLSIGTFLLVKQILVHYHKGKKNFAFIMTVLFLSFYNLIIILYFAGIHNPNSPFSIV